MKKTAYSLGLGLAVGFVSMLAMGQARVPFTKVTGVNIAPSSLSVSGVADQFVCTATANVCEVESNITAATMTSTVPAFDVGPIPTPDANDRLACFSYGASGAKTRVACVDTEGDVNAASYTASGTANEFVCSGTTNVCEVVSSINAATMTSTVPAFDIGPTATPDANDRLGCFSYGASGSKTRVACVDTEGDLNANSLTTAAGSTANALVLTTNSYLCLNGSTCTTRGFSEDGANMKFWASGSNNLTLAATDNFLVKNTVAQSNITVQGRFITENTLSTIADSGGAGAASATLTMNVPNYRIDCQDADGCNITMGETSAVSGQEVTFTNMSANTVNFADTAGVSELAGTFAAGQYDTLRVKYVVDRWIELSRSNN